MFMENLPKKGPLLREVCAQNPPTWAAHSYPQHVMYPPPGAIRLRQKFLLAEAGALASTATCLSHSFGTRFATFASFPLCCSPDYSVE